MGAAMTAATAAILARREEILRICARHGCGTVSVFGSIARGEAQEGSDLDLLVELTGNRTSWWPGGLIDELEELLGCRVDVAEPEALHPSIRERVLREAVPL
jgi:predicted nucleotidyltransferase